MIVKFIETMTVQKDRDAFFDNIKAILIFLVVLGHILELFLNIPIFNAVFKIIYSFHMPAFVFVAGYFSKNIAKQEDSIVFDFLIPYFVFNSVFQFILTKSLAINLFEPIYAYWFLLSMFLWKSFLKKIVGVRYILFISILISLYCGAFDDVSRYLSVSRTIVFFPYFILGYFCTSETITKIKLWSNYWGMSLFFCSALVLLYFFDQWAIPVEFLRGAESYNKMGVPLFVGIFSRLFFILIAISFILSLINLIPKKKLLITNLGRHTLVIYLFHPFLILVFKKVSNFFEGSNEYFEFILCIIAAVFITGMLSFSFITKWYLIVFGWISKILKKEYLVKSNR